MAKITSHGGASDKTLPAADAAAAETDPAPEAAADQARHAGGAWVSEPGPMTVEMPRGGAVVASLEALREHARNLAEPDFGESLAQLEADEEGGEESSLGSSSSASTEPQPTSSEPSSKTRRKPARKTASRSGQDPTDSSSAPSTDGGQTEATSAADAAE